jgi:hypothetical protein
MRGMAQGDYDHIDIETQCQFDGLSMEVSCWHHDEATDRIPQ